MTASLAPPNPTRMLDRKLRLEPRRLKNKCGPNRFHILILSSIESATKSGTFAILSETISIETNCMRQLVLRNFQSPGDIVMLTAALERLHDLAIRELRLLHCVELPLLEILLLIPLTGREDYRCSGGGRESSHWEAYPTHQFIHRTGRQLAAKAGAAGSRGWFRLATAMPKTRARICAWTSSGDRRGASIS